MEGMFCDSRFLEKSETSGPFLNASKRMPSNLRSKIQSGPMNRSCVSVAAIGWSHSGKFFEVRRLDAAFVFRVFSILNQL
jgi:hypothetical protein